MKKLSRELLINTVSTNRKTLNLTQTQLAPKTGILCAMVERIKNKEFLPNVEQLETAGETLHFEVVNLYMQEKGPEGISHSG